MSTNEIETKVRELRQLQTLMEACGPIGFIRVSAITLIAATALHSIAGAKKKAPCINADQSQMQETR